MKRATLFVSLVFFVLSCRTSTPTVTITSAPPGSVVGTVVSMDGAPLPGVSVTLQSKSYPTRFAFTDVHGTYAFLGVRPGTYTVVTQLAGFTSTTASIAVSAEHGVALASNMTIGSVSESITVTASAPNIGWLPDHPQPLPRRAKDVAKQPAPVAPPPVAPAAVTVTAPAFQAVQEIQAIQKGASYGSFEEHEFVETRDENVTTFAIDVDRASYANVRRYLVGGQAPPRDAVRIEEMLNYFTYSYPQPKDNVPFSVTTEVAGCPWNAKNRLVRVGIQGKNLEQWRMAPNNLVFLLDVSGSMGSWDKLALIQDAFKLLVDELRAEDRVAIVVYAGAAGLVLPSTSGADKATILAAIDHLSAGGSTAGGAGIQLAYDVAQQNFLQQGNNRVILATDGDFNVGVTSMEGLQQLIEQKRQSGVYLSVVGVGTGDLQDATMEMLADKGNGNYAYLDSLEEAKKVFSHELTGTLVTIAKDVKVQLDFDPNAVTSYRQIGYENRALANQDFEDDAKDAGELGAGHSVTALFEIVPATSSPTKLATLRLRYKEPTGTQSKVLTSEVIDEGKSAYDASSDMQFAAAVASLGMLLRDSPNKGTLTWDDMLQLARVSQGPDLDGTRNEFMKLALMAKNSRP